LHTHLALRTILLVGTCGAAISIFMILKGIVFCLFVCSIILNFLILILDIRTIGDLLIKLTNQRTDDLDYLSDVTVEMAAFSGRPDRFLGVHFFNPVQVNTFYSYQKRKKHVITETWKKIV
jgi:hypothetical protein